MRQLLNADSAGLCVNVRTPINKCALLSAADFGHQRPEDRLSEHEWTGSAVYDGPQTQLQGDSTGDPAAL